MKTRVSIRISDVGEQGRTVWEQTLNQLVEGSSPSRLTTMQSPGQDNNRASGCGSLFYRVPSLPLQLVESHVNN
jgi:hypothetical protein